MADLTPDDDLRSNLAVVDQYVDHVGSCCFNVQLIAWRIGSIASPLGSCVSSARGDGAGAVGHEPDGDRRENESLQKCGVIRERFEATSTITSDTIAEGRKCSKRFIKRLAAKRTPVWLSACRALSSKV